MSDNLPIGKTRLREFFISKGSKTWFGRRERTFARSTKTSTNYAFDLPGKAGFVASTTP